MFDIKIQTPPEQQSYDYDAERNGSALDISDPTVFRRGHWSLSRARSAPRVHPGPGVLLSFLLAAVVSSSIPAAAVGVDRRSPRQLRLVPLFPLPLVRRYPSWLASVDSSPCADFFFKFLVRALQPVQLVADSVHLPRGGVLGLQLIVLSFPTTSSASVTQVLP
jgi:hypothetical protein